VAFAAERGNGVSAGPFIPLEQCLPRKRVGSGVCQRRSRVVNCNNGMNATDQPLQPRECPAPGPTRRTIAAASMLLALSVGSVEAGGPPMKNIKPIAPAVSTGSGLLLEPALSLPEFKREDFLAAIGTLGSEKLHKSWTNAIVTLPLRPHAHADGLSDDEVMSYIEEAKRLFDAGEAVPVSDVGLISTQEAVVRQPMLNNIAAFSNSAVRVYLLVQKTLSSPSWGYFAILQDLTSHPVRDHYAKLGEHGAKFMGRSCYACHASGPLTIHPVRPDLVSDPLLAATISHQIAEQPRSEFVFPAHAPKPPTGEPLTLSFCAHCHAEDGRRDRLYQAHAHPIRVLVDFGYMPPDRHLSPEEIAQLKAWLDHKP